MLAILLTLLLWQPRPGHEWNLRYAGQPYRVNAWVERDDVRVRVEPIGTGRDKVLGVSLQVQSEGRSSWRNLALRGFGEGQFLEHYYFPHGENQARLTVYFRWPKSANQTEGLFKLEGWSYNVQR